MPSFQPTKGLADRSLDNGWSYHGDREPNPVVYDE